jgi:hypothetical protein
MMSKTAVRGFAALAILWNVLGVASYLNHVGVFGRGGPPPGGATMPGFVVACYALGTFTGVAAAIGLASMRRWARPTSWMSLLALVIDWGWVFGFSGAGSVPIGVTVLVVATLLVALTERAAKLGWLR